MLRTVPDRETAAAVLAAFESARRAGHSAAECYRAGVLAWRTRHPEQAPEYAAKQAVAVILAKEKDGMFRIEP